MSLGLISQTYTLESGSESDSSENEVDVKKDVDGKECHDGMAVNEACLDGTLKSEVAVAGTIHDGTIISSHIGFLLPLPSLPTCSTSNGDDKQKGKLVRREVLKCPFCFKTFPGTDELIRHLVIHDEDNKNELSNGEITTKDGKQMERCTELEPSSYQAASTIKCQIFSHVTKPRPYKCRECSYSFTNSGNRSRHMKTAHSKTGNGRVWKCHRCPSYFSSLRYLKYHVNQVHRNIRLATRSNKKGTAFVCNVCGKCFGDIYSLAVHLYNHSRTRDDARKCPVCDKESSLRGNTVRHLKTQHGEKKTLDTLKLLQASSPKRRNTNSHTSLQNLESLLRPCRIILTRCDGRTSIGHALPKESPSLVTDVSRNYRSKTRIVSAVTKNGLNGRKIKEAHLRRMKYKCPYCFKTFLEAEFLIKHLPSHTGSKDNWSKESLKMQTSEMKTISEEAADNNYKYNAKGNTSETDYVSSQDLKRFKCHKCTYSCTTTHSLAIHISRHRKGGKPFKCSLCSCYFRNIKALQIHMGRLHKSGSMKRDKP